MSLDDLHTLGSSGLAVSPLTLGTMTMGNSEWGSSDGVSAEILDAYVDAGGNAIDTADVYSGGRSEELLGAMIAERGLRDRLVLATKYGFSAEQRNALAGGNGRKNLHRALEGSLRRLQTDYIDLYWMHVWDGVTPAEEIVSSLTDLVRAGKIRYYGLSDLPAWFATQVATLARAHGLPSPVALQLEYSLVERSIEREYVPAARALGLGIVPWSPLAGGLLSGKYTRGDGRGSGDGRLAADNPFGDSKFSDHNFDVVEVLIAVAQECERPPSQVALAWLAQQRAVTTTLVGARKLSQLQDNLASLEVELTSDQLDRLDQVSSLTPGVPADLWTSGFLGGAVHGGVSVSGWRS